MRKVLVIAALAALAILLDSGMASAGRRCGGGRHRGGRGGCGGGYAGGCGYGGGCGSGGGGCGYGGGCGGGYGYGGGGYAGGYGGYGLGGSLGSYVLQGAVDATATVVVDLPADATLTIDGEPTTSTSSARVFQTPALEPGQTFHYTFQAQVERDGKVQSVTRRVEVRAGEQTRVNLALPAATVAAR